MPRHCRRPGVEQLDYLDGVASDRSFFVLNNSGLPSDGHHYFTELLVRLHVAVRLNDLLEWNVLAMMGLRLPSASPSLMNRFPRSGRGGPVVTSVKL